MTRNGPQLVGYTGHARDQQGHGPTYRSWGTLRIQTEASAPGKGSTMIGPAPRLAVGSRHDPPRNDGGGGAVERPVYTGASFALPKKLPWVRATEFDIVTT